MVELPPGSQPYARSSNTVYRTPDGATVVKVFRRPLRGEAQREWSALRLLAVELTDRSPFPRRFDESDAEAPVIEMSRLPGEPLAGAPSVEALAALVDVYAELHRLDPSTYAGLPEVVGAPAEMLDRIARRRQLATPADLAREPGVREAWRAAGAWLDHDDAAASVAVESPCFGRGDANLANHLWDGERLRIVDLEDSGRTDVAIQLAELAEHLSNHELPDHLWPELHAALGLDARAVRRWLQARRALAIFWLGQLVTNPRAREINRQGRTADQAGRVLALLG